MSATQEEYEELERLHKNAHNRIRELEDSNGYANFPRSQFTFGDETTYMFLKRNVGQYVCITVRDSAIIGWWKP